MVDVSVRVGEDKKMCFVWVFFCFFFFYGYSALLALFFFYSFIYKQNKFVIFLLIIWFSKN